MHLPFTVDWKCIFIIKYIIWSIGHQLKEKTASFSFSEVATILGILSDVSFPAR